MRAVWRERVRRASERIRAGRLGDAAERWAKAVQMRHLRKQGRHEQRGSDVVITDDLLKFHAKDGRDAFRERLAARERELGLAS